jgi:hypothetical protein
MANDRRNEDQEQVSDEKVVGRADDENEEFEDIDDSDEGDQDEDEDEDMNEE